MAIAPPHCKADNTSPPSPSSTLTLTPSATDSRRIKSASRSRRYFCTARLRRAQSSEPTWHHHPCHRKSTVSVAKGGSLIDPPHPNGRPFVDVAEKAAKRCLADYDWLTSFGIGNEVSLNLRPPRAILKRDEPFVLRIQAR